MKETKDRITDIPISQVHDLAGEQIFRRDRRVFRRLNAELFPYGEGFGVIEILDCAVRDFRIKEVYIAKDLFSFIVVWQN